MLLFLFGFAVGAITSGAAIPLLLACVSGAAWSIAKREKDLG